MSGPRKGSYTRSGWGNSRGASGMASILGVSQPTKPLTEESLADFKPAERLWTAVFVGKDSLGQHFANVLRITTDRLVSTTLTAEKGAASIEKLSILLGACFGIYEDFEFKGQKYTAWEQVREKAEELLTAENTEPVKIEKFDEIRKEVVGALMEHLPEGKRKEWHGSPRDIYLLFAVDEGMPFNKRMEEFANRLKAAMEYRQRKMSGTVVKAGEAPKVIDPRQTEVL